MMRFSRQEVAWAMYDWANSAFATTVMAGFFPLFFKQYWAGDLAVEESSFWLGLANSVASILVAALAPVLGAIADQGSAKKRFLIFFAALGMVMTGALSLVASGWWVAAVLVYVLSLIGFSGANVFYDAMLPALTAEKRFDVVSALGYALGYLGGGVLFAFDVVMVLWPHVFGFSDETAALHASFVTVAVWWAVFSLPLIFVVPEAERNKVSLLEASRLGLAQLAATFRKAQAMRHVFLFLLAYWLYIDGVDTVVRMAVDFGLSVGFSPHGLIIALLITQFVGFPAAYLFGHVGRRWGAKKGIMAGLVVYTLVSLWAMHMQHAAEFYAMAVVIGLVQGGVQALSRSLYARIIPQDKAAEFFGFFNMLGKFAAVIGPVLMGMISVATGNPRLSMLAVLALFLLGMLLLRLVDVDEGMRAARQLVNGSPVQ